MNNLEENKNKKEFFKNICTWWLIVVVSIIFILLGHRFATKDLPVLDNTQLAPVRGQVVEIIKSEVSKEPIAISSQYSSENIYFKFKILSGHNKNIICEGTQNISDLYPGSQNIKKVQQGDKVLMTNGGVVDVNMDTSVASEQINSQGDTETTWQFIDFYRFDKIIILALVFAGLLIIIGRWKGLNTILSLLMTFTFVFFVFVPSVMNGKNIYMAACITCLFTIVMTLLLINGTKEKTWVTMAGCISGTLVSAIITFIMNKFLHLTGFIDEHSMYLSLINPERPIDLVAIVYAAIIIGAMGAIMDVAMDLSSALYELSVHVPDISFKKMFKSGMQIGGDIMGTMANTLVLAYIGSSLCSIILLFAYSSSLTHLLNREIVIIEFLQALTGSLGILLTVPFTVIISAMVYLKKRVN